MTDPFNILEWGIPTPHDGDAGGALPAVLSEPPAHFSYIGRALTVAEFAAFLPFYDFGLALPSWLVLHHTAVPTVEQWTAGESGMAAEQIKTKRLNRLAGIKEYYWKVKQWDRGPHIFSDERFIYLFSPMNAPGIHAADGNGYPRSFSVGWEVIGDYSRQRWSNATAGVVAQGVALLQQRLKTFELRDGKGPGNVSAHRHYNKPSCPGNAITPDSYLPLFRQARASLEPVSSPPAQSLRRSRVRGVPIYQRQDRRGIIAGYLEPGEVVAIDATYPDGGGHLQDGRGFVDLGALE